GQGRKAGSEMPVVVPDRPSAFAARQAVLAGPVSAPGGACSRRFTVHLLAYPASPFAHVLNRVCLPDHRHQELTLRHSPGASVSTRITSQFSSLRLFTQRGLREMLAAKE